MNELQIFSFGENEVRTVKDDKGEMWWVAADVCKALNIEDVRQVIERLDDDEKLSGKIYHSGQNREMWLVNESGLYNLIFRSYKAEAKAFRRWVTHEVLPSIRKTGSYHSTEIVKLADDWQRAQDNIIAYNKKWNEEHKIKIS